MSTPNTSTVPATLPSSSRNVLSAKGNVIGVEYAIGRMTASQLRESLKGQGYSGRDLTNRVNAALNNEASQRKIVAVGSVEALHQKGFLGDKLVVKEKKGVACLSFVAPKAPKAAKADASKAKIVAKLKALGCTEEEIAELLK